MYAHTALEAIESLRNSLDMLASQLAAAQASDDCDDTSRRAHHLTAAREWARDCLEQAVEAEAEWEQVIGAADRADHLTVSERAAAEQEWERHLAAHPTAPTYE